jgi:hypothetical protein
MREASRQLPGHQPAGELEQRQRVAPGLGDDPVPHPLVEPTGDRRLEQRMRIAVTQPADQQLGHAREAVLLTGLTEGEHHGDGFGQEATGGEGEDLSGGAIEPLGIVDQTDERPLAGDLRQQTQQGQADEEPVRHVPLADAQRRGESVALGSWQALQAGQHRCAQLVQPGERQLHLGLDARRPGDPAPRRSPVEVAQQRGLADARLAPHDERLAVAVPDVRHEPVQQLAFLLPPPESGAGVTIRHDHPLC